MKKGSTCNLHHRIKRTITLNGLELTVYQCCDSRECLFKHIKGDVTFCEYDENHVDRENEEVDNNRSDDGENVHEF